MITEFTKTYNFGGTDYSFKFRYLNGQYTYLSPEFDIIAFDGIEHGYETEDLTAFYPTRTRIVLDNFGLPTYDSINNLIQLYDSEEIPFDLNEILTIEIFKGNVSIFKGIVDSQTYDANTMTNELLIIDGCNRFKNISLDNYSLLNYMHTNGIGGRYPIYYNASTTETGCYFWGRQGVALTTAGILTGLQVNQLRDINIHVKNTLEMFLKCINPNANLTVNTDWKFSTVNVITTDYVLFSDLWFAYFFANFMGRILQKPQTVYISNLVQSGFTLAWAGKINGVQYETWFENHGEGLANRSLSDMIKLVCNNFHLQFGFKNYNEIYLNKKWSINYNNAISLDDNVITKSKSLFKIPKSYVKVTDKFSNQVSDNGEYSSFDNQSEQLFIDIYMSAYHIGSVTGYGLYYRVGGNFYPVLYIRDPVTNYTGEIWKSVCNAEWLFQSEFINSFSLELWGIGYEYTDIFSVVDEWNRTKFLKVLTMKKDYMSNKTNMEALILNGGSDE